MNGKKSWVLLLVGWSIVFLWIGFVFELSVQTGEQTAGLSSGIVERILKWLPWITEQFSFDQVHAWIRKAAHVAAFGFLGVALSAAVGMTVRLLKGNRKIAAAAVVLTCTLIAVASEVVKLGVPGRHLDWDEAALNVISTWAGIGLVAVAHRIFR